MDVVFLTDMYNVGGGERNLIELATQLKKSNINVIVLLPCEGKLSKELEDEGIKFHCYKRNIINRRWILGLPILIDWFKIIRILSFFKKIKISPDVFHCNSSNVIPLAKLLSIFIDECSIIWTCHGPWEIHSGIKNFFIDKFVKTTIAITPEIYNKITFKEKKLVPLGINNKNLKIKDFEDRAVKKILCIARWQYIKGQDVLVIALKKILENCNVELHFFGEILLKSKKDLDFYLNTKRKVEDLGLGDVVFFHDYDEKIKFKINQYDLLCIPSRYESFSITMLEGLNCGINIVAPNIGGPQYVLENNISGVLFQPDNTIDLALKCIDVLTGNIKMEKDNILKRGADFLINKQCSKIIDIYKEMVHYE